MQTHEDWLGWNWFFTFTFLVQLLLSRRLGSMLVSTLEGVMLSCAACSFVGLKTVREKGEILFSTLTGGLCKASQTQSTWPTLVYVANDILSLD